MWLAFECASLRHPVTRSVYTHAVAYMLNQIAVYAQPDRRMISSRMHFGELSSGSSARDFTLAARVTDSSFTLPELSSPELS